MWLTRLAFWYLPGPRFARYLGGFGPILDPSLERFLIGPEVRERIKFRHPPDCLGRGAAIAPSGAWGARASSFIQRLLRQRRIQSAYVELLCTGDDLRRPRRHRLVLWLAGSV